MQGNPGALRNAQEYVEAGIAFMYRGQFSQALECAGRAAEMDPNLASAHLLLAQLLVQGSQSNKARDHAVKAVAMEPDNAGAYAVLGSCLQSLGFAEEAGPHFRKAIELRPEQGYAYMALVFGGVEKGGALIEQMLALTEEGKLPPSEMQALHYALGRSYENSEHYSDAMRHYDEANRIAYGIKSGDRQFSRRAHAAATDWVLSFFTPQLLDHYRSKLPKVRGPIFIVGAIRSGTTLMEQILSSHPSIEAGGELPFWTRNGQSAIDGASRSINLAKVAELRNTYLAILRQIAPGAVYVTDKMPGNTIALGIIHLAFPQARIINMIRGSADTCLSIYTTPNEARFDFAHNKQNIGFAHKTHLRLMQHWREVLSKDRFLDVQYEELVSETERVSRHVVDFCGLDWSELCLSPGKNDRSVVTPSVWQVRKPIYQTSVERWRRFEEWIPEFMNLD